MAAHTAVQNNTTESLKCHNTRNNLVKELVDKMHLIPGHNEITRNGIVDELPRLRARQPQPVVEISCKD